MTRARVDRTDPPVSPDPPALRVRRAQSDSRATLSRAPPEPWDRRDLSGFRDSRELEEVWDRGDRKERLDHREHEASRASTDHRASPENRAHRDQTDRPVRKDLRASKDLQDKPV